ncbi:MAG: Re/Si-specific NAD(P)(+) transhydrogenase subunit alpha [Myxococcaceae bacterium]
MQIAVLKETAPRERRVALVPDTVARLVKSGHRLVVEQGAGVAAFFPDKLYEGAGAQLASGPAQALSEAELVLKVQPPGVVEARRIPQGTTLISLISQDESLLSVLESLRISALALERVPRITRAQSMDVLSSQATVAGYSAALMAATHLPRFFPMLMTAAGNVTPAKAFILGAGVAGLQAIATCRRLGAVVSAFDVRPAVREQVQSLGATFVAVDAVGAEGQGGYAAAQSDQELERTRAAIAAHLKDIDVVISTAAIPGKRAPLLVTEAMVRSMRPGSVIVDVSAESGGNCTMTRAGETVEVDGVSVVGPMNLPSAVPFHASQMFSKNLQSLLGHLIAKDGTLTLDVGDEITGAMVMTHGGQRRPPTGWSAPKPSSR